MKRKLQYPWFQDGDYIVTAFAERASGPGWSNTPIWVIVQNADRKLRQECIQPSEQDEFMQTLYNVNEAAHSAMRRAVQCAIGYERQKP